MSAFISSAAESLAVSKAEIDNFRDKREVQYRIEFAGELGRGGSPARE